jgi:hypothetical protein
VKKKGVQRPALKTEETVLRHWGVPARKATLGEGLGVIVTIFGSISLMELYATVGSSGNPPPLRSSLFIEEEQTFGWSPKVKKTRLTRCGVRLAVLNPLLLGRKEISRR